MQTLLQTDTKTTRVVQVAFTHVVTSAEGTANTLDLDIDELPAIDEAIGVTIRKADGTFNVTALDVSFATNVLTVSATALTAGEVLTGFAIGSLDV